MRKDSPFLIDLHAAAENGQALTAEADDGFFQAEEGTGILGGHVVASISASGPRAGVYRVDYTIEGDVRVPCDRCLDELSIHVSRTDSLNVAAWDSDVEGDEETPVAQRGDRYDLGWNVYESVLLARPTVCTHPDGQCDPAVTERLAGQTD
ncbi:MAG: DUF177 domain-containing protein [Bacteroidaceae bacterium]|nr:DUF177 domain-containing protein [Bacteroidaceae bacterium]